MPTTRLHFKPMEYIKSFFDIKDRVAVLSGGGGILAGEMAKGLLNSGQRSFY